MPAGLGKESLRSHPKQCILVISTHHTHHGSMTFDHTAQLLSFQTVDTIIE